MATPDPVNRPKKTHADGPGPNQPRSEAGQDAADSTDPRSETEYLAQQAQEAKQAMSKAFGEFTQKLGHSVSLNTAANNHPWLTVAAGAVAGFATAAVITPSKTDSALKRLRDIEKALRPPPVAPPPPVDDPDAPQSKAASSGMGQNLMKELFSLARPLVSSGISALLAAKHAAKETSEEVLMPEEKGAADEAVAS
jgi:hypothetical protein